MGSIYEVIVYSGYVFISLKDFFFFPGRTYVESRIVVSPFKCCLLSLLFIPELQKERKDPRGKILNI